MQRARGGHVLSPGRDSAALRTSQDGGFTAHAQLQVLSHPHTRRRPEHPVLSQVQRYESWAHLLAVQRSVRSIFAPVEIAFHYCYYFANVLTKFKLLSILVGNEIIELFSSWKTEYNIKHE